MSQSGPLVCVPHAGGASSEYRGWRGGFGGREVRAVSLPGREQRFNEPFLVSVQQMAQFVVRTAAADVPRLALWGHSLGALVAYEAAVLLEEAGVEVELLAAAGHAGPGVHRRGRRVHALPERELVAALRAMGGLDPAVEESAELLELLLPRLRADLEAAESYQPKSRPRLRCAVLALGGEADPDVPAADLDAWRAVTDGPFEVARFPGGHFFPRTATDDLLKLLRGRLGVGPM